MRMEFPEESAEAVVDDILLWVFLLDKMFIIVDYCLKKFLTSCTIQPAKCNEMTMIKNFNQAKYLIWFVLNSFLMYCCCLQ